MIRIKRGLEPKSLAPVRATELVRVRAVAAIRQPSSDDVGDKYQVVKLELWQRQHHKCCYCEHICQFGFHDVEHYRPKARADRGPGFASHGYWWLAWSWSNLMFSCPGCNRSGKNDKFPLTGGSVPLVAEQSPPAGEQPLLIDPAAESPRSHIQFKPVVINGRRMWLPTGVTERGRKTITDLDLDRDELRDLFTSHVEIFIMPVINRLNGAVAAGNKTTVRQIWNDEVEPLTLLQRPYSRLSFDVLDHHFPRHVRKQFALNLKLG
ncbi:MAG: hypothetical protein FJ267_09195 [Planctomycetes bacterium]|nr:hypothetical protein [Planctomycetota bacterium]